MKKYVPIKYIIGIIGLFFIIPILLILLMVLIIGLNNLTIPISIFLVFLIIIGPIVYCKNQENASVIIKDNKITNNINDGTSNFGWTEEINNIKKVQVANNAEIKKHFTNCKSKKVLIINFGVYNVKYISMDLFTNKQTIAILNYLRNKSSSKTVIS